MADSSHSNPFASQLSQQGRLNDWGDSLPRLHAAILADLGNVLATLCVYRASRPFVDPAFALMEADLEHALGLTRAAQELTDELWRVVCRLDSGSSDKEFS